MLVVKQSLCLECGGCVPLCPEEALLLSFDKVEVDQRECTDCRICVIFCPVEALEVIDGTAV